MNVRDAALQARRAVAAGRLSARDACERLGTGLEARDRALLLHLVAGATRHQLTLDHLLSLHLRGHPGRLQEAAREAMRLGTFQLVFSSRIPPHAAVQATVETLKGTAHRAVPLANAVLRSLSRSIEGKGPAGPEDDPFRTLPDGEGWICRFRSPVLPEGDPRSPGILSIRASLPPWMLVRWRERFGPEAAERIALESLKVPDLFLRTPEGPVRLGHGKDPGLLLAVQDPSAQAVVSEGVQPRPGERILDLCAGVGGKACAMAERGANVLAVDLSERRLERLRESASRLRLTIDMACRDALDPDPAWLGAFDAVLLDAPCTNTGVLRRRPEARWRLRPEDPPRMASLQKRLLEAALRCVSPGGRLVYSTCSLEREENEEVVEGRRREAERFRLPDAEGDGGYWARLFRPAV